MSTTSGPPHASFWAEPPEFYIDENMAGRTVRRFITDLGYVVHTPSRGVREVSVRRGPR